MGLREFARSSMGIEKRSDPALAWSDWIDMLTSFSFNGVNYALPGHKQEDIDQHFPTMARAAFKASPIVAACIWNRMNLFSEVRFMFQRIESGRPGELYAPPAKSFRRNELNILDHPWQNATTGDLLSRMLLYADLAGNAYIVRRRGGVLQPLRPDWVTIVGGVEGNEDATVWHPDAKVLGYLYHEGGPYLDKEPIVLLPEEVAHFAPLADPEARFRGMSWITPVIREVMADKAATDHKLQFFENAATPQLAVKLDVQDLEKYKAWLELFRKEHQGTRNAYKTMFLGAGADVTAIGTNLQQLEFKVTQGAGETRIAAAAGVPPVIAGFSEGLEGSSLNAGNYQAARRRFADQTIRPLWRNVCGSLESIINVDPDSRLWYDVRDVAALQEDQKDAAEIQMTRSQSIKTLVDAGFTAESVVAAVDAEDFTLLKHTGLFSVQMQPPGSEAPSSNGNGAAVPALN